jgi:hypothetical protein
MGKQGIKIKTVDDIPEDSINKIKKSPELGLQDFQERSLSLMPESGLGTGKIINILSGYGIEVDEAVKQEASLEEMYSNILKEVEEA